jgi:hypothetical protein
MSGWPLVRDLTVVVLLILSLRTLIGSTRSWLAYRWLRRGAKHRSQAVGSPFVILLPAYREQSMVDETLAHFAALNYPRELFRIVVVTSDRERQEHEVLSASLPDFTARLWRAVSDRKPLTEELLTGHLPGAAVRKLLAEPAASAAELERRVTQLRAEWGVTADVVEVQATRINRELGSPLIRQVCAPPEYRYKAGQMRYAFEVLDEALQDWPALRRCRYVAVYDFDSRPHPDTLRAGASAGRSEAALLQQPALTVPCPRPSAGFGHSLFTYVEALMHTRHALQMELASLLIDVRLHALSPTLVTLLRSGVHAVGIGLFIDRFQLDGLGGIPAVVDDLPLGWRAAVSGRTMASVARPVTYQAYQSPTQAKRSRRFVFEAYLRASGEIASPAAPSWAVGIQRLRVARRALYWLAGPYPRLAFWAFAVAVVPVFTAVNVLVCYLLVVAETAMVYSLWRAEEVTVGANMPMRLVSALVAPAQLLWRGSGPRAAVLRRLWRNEAGTSAVTEKTER